MHLDDAPTRAPVRRPRPSPREEESRARRLLRSAEWLGWPRIVIARTPVGAEPVGVAIPWIPELATLPAGVHAVGSAPRASRALPRASAANEHEPWAQYRRARIDSIHRLRAVAMDAREIRGAAAALRALRRTTTTPSIATTPGHDACRHGSAADTVGTLPITLSVTPSGTVHLPDTAATPSAHNLLVTLASLVPDSRAFTASLAALLDQPIPAIPEAFLLCWLFSGGSPSAVAALADDLAENAARFRTDWNGPVPAARHRDTARRPLRARQAHRVALVGAVHGLIPPDHFTPAFWLSSVQDGLWESRHEDAPCTPGDWDGRCRRAEQAMLRLAIGLGATEPDVLYTLMLVFSVAPHRIAGSRAHDAIEQGLALARAGLEARELLDRREWWDLAQGARRSPARLRRLVRHPWFGPGIGAHWDCDAFLALPSSLLDWVLGLPARLLPDASSSTRPARAVLEELLSFLSVGSAEQRRRIAFVEALRDPIAAELIRRCAEDADATGLPAWTAQVEAALLVAMEWATQDFEDPAAVFAAALDRLASAARPLTDPFAAVVLSAGCPRRLFEIAARLPRFKEANIRLAWAALANAPRVRESLLRLSPSRTGEAIARLEDVARIVRFAPELAARLGDGADDAPLCPAFAPIRELVPEREEALRRMQWLQSDAGEGSHAGPSRALRRAMKRVETATCGPALGTPAAAHAITRQHLANRIDEALHALEMARICRLVGQALARRLAAWIGAVPTSPDATTADWQHALRLAASLTDNRRSLRRLLRAESQGSAQAWIRDHPANRRFLARLAAAGADASAWCAGLDARRVVVGHDLEIRTESRPLEILKMGTLFGTCLSAGDLSAYAAVANAIDVNKQVIYVRFRGRIVARKLVAVLLYRGPDGAERPRLVGYRVYGTCPGAPDDDGKATLAAAVHECCAVWAQACRTPLGMIPSAEPERLVAHAWYDDGQVPWHPEPLPPAAAPPLPRSPRTR